MTYLQQECGFMCMPFRHDYGKQVHQRHMQSSLVPCYNPGVQPDYHIQQQHKLHPSVRFTSNPYPLAGERGQVRAERSMHGAVHGRHGGGRLKADVRRQHHHQVRRDYHGAAQAAGRDAEDGVAHPLVPDACERQ